MSSLGFDSVWVEFLDKRSTLVYLWIPQKQCYHRFYMEGGVYMA